MSKVERKSFSVAIWQIQESDSQISLTYQFWIIHLLLINRILNYKKLITKKLEQGIENKSRFWIFWFADKISAISSAHALILPSWCDNKNVTLQKMRILEFVKTENNNPITDQRDPSWKIYLSRLVKLKSILLAQVRVKISAYN